MRIHDPRHKFIIPLESPGYLTNGGRRIEHNFENISLLVGQ
jgi:hypothetical protein